MNYMFHSHDEELIECIILAFGKPTFLISHSELYNREIDIDYKDLVFSAYPKVDWEKVPPIDLIILKDFMECEKIYLKLSERLFEGSGVDQRKRSYHKHLRFWYWLISKNKNKLDCVIFDNLPHEGYDLIIYYVCKYLKIPFLTFYRLPIKPQKFLKRYPVEDIFEHGKIVDRKCNSAQISDCSKKSKPKFSDELANIISDYENRTNYSSFNKPLKFSEKKANTLKENLKKVYSKKIFEYIFYRWIKPYFNEDIQRFTRKDPYYERSKIIKKYIKLNSIKPDLNKIYIYVPLHFQPELSTTPIGQDYAFQELMIAQLAWCAKFLDIVIYVKEHPRASSIFSRNLAFYKSFLSLSNVFLVETNTDNNLLIENCFATATVSGSASWEAFLMDKPALLFGTTIFENAPNVYRVNSTSSISSALNRVLSQPKINPHDKYEFLEKLDKVSFNAIVGGKKDRLFSLANFSIDESNQNIIKAIKEFAVFHSIGKI